MILKQKHKSGAFPHLSAVENYPDLLVDPFFFNLRKKEFSRLDESNHTYLDFTGGGLYAESQLNTHFQQLQQSVLGNPHSTNPSSQLSTNRVDETRAKVLEYFNGTEDYECIFTSNASAALKIVGECYPFYDDGHMLMTYDNHNSVNGIREYCTSKGGSYEYCKLYMENLRADKDQLYRSLLKYPNKKNKLFAFPAQSNVSGVKHQLSDIKRAQDNGWDVLLDCAAYVPTNKLDLKEVSPEFASVSFYKIFGYPTGIGCLLVKKSVFHKLKKPWFAGGTVSFVSVNTGEHFLHNNHEKFENGTINYLDIPAVKIGLDWIDSIGIDKINKRVTELTGLMIEEMSSLKHSNGQCLVNVLGPKENTNRGGTIIFNLNTVEGKVDNYFEIEKAANNANISLRTGCFCNPGIDEIMSCVSNEESLRYYSFMEEHEYNYEKLVVLLGRMRGAIRVSLGYVTDLKDINNFIGFLRGYLK